MPWDRQSLQNSKMVWLLDLYIRGKIYRFSTEPIEVSHNEIKIGPVTYQYVSGLEFLDYEDTVAVMDSEMSAREVAVSVLFGTAHPDGWAAIADPTKEVGGTRAELSLHIRGNDYKDRQLIVSGYIQEPTHGAQFEPVQFTISESDYDDPVMFPPLTAKCDGQTWPTRKGSQMPLAYCPAGHGTPATDADNEFKYTDSAEDEPYCFVFGKPGSHPPTGWENGPQKGAGLAENFPAFPAVPVSIVRMDHTDEWNHPNRCTLLLAGHELFRGDPQKTGGWPADDQIWIYNETFHGLDSPNSAWFGGLVPGLAAGDDNLTVKEVVDGRGRVVSVMDVGNIYRDSGYPASTIEALFENRADSIKPGSKLWAAFSLDCGGIPNNDRTAPLSGAGEVVAYLLDRSGLRVNTLNNRTILQELDAYRLDFWINESRSPWEIISEDILPLCPISPRVTQEGLGFILWKWDATKADAVAHFHADRQSMERQGPVEVSPFSDVYNVIKIEYCYEGPTGKPLKSLTYTHEETEYRTGTVDGTPSDHADTYPGGVVFNPYAYHSYTQYGSRAGLVIEAPAVEQDATAAKILDWKIRYHSQTHRTVNYRLPQEAQAHQVGDVVTVTDPGIGWDRAVCLVTGLVRAPGQTVLTFTTVSNWVRDGIVS